jgi:hypothetical protein
VLVNHSYPLAPGIGGAENRGVYAIFQDSAAVRLMNPGQDLDERALASPVLASERMHPPGPKAEINVVQNREGPKTFRDPAKFNYRTH